MHSPITPKTPINIIFAKNNEIRVIPGNAAADRGDTLIFHLAGDPKTLVTITGSGSGAEWISGAANGGQFIEVVVGPEVAQGAYKYNIAVDGIGTLDPEVTIRY